MIKSYSEHNITKALDKLGISEQLTHTGFVPVRAITNIAFPNFDLYIPKGKLFYITGFVYDSTCKESCYKLQLAFPDTESEKLNDYYLLCKIDPITYELTNSVQIPLTELMEKVSDETAEVLGALYTKQCAFEETKGKRSEMYSTIEDITSIVMLLTAIILMLCSCIVMVTASLPVYICPILISAIPILITSITMCGISHNYDYERTKDAKTRRDEMAALYRRITHAE